MPSMQELMTQYAPPAQPSMQDLMAQYQPQPDSPMVGALKDIGSNTLESLKGTATQTGAAMSEPMNSPGMENWSQHPVMGPIDAAVRGIGKVGNAVGGSYGALTSPLTGALSASVENSGIIPAAAKAIKENLVPTDPRFTADISPEAQHQIAMQGGSDLTNAVMMGKAGEQGAINTGKAAPSAPYDPMADVWAQLQKQSQNPAPRFGFMGSNTSEVNAPYESTPQNVIDLAKQTYGNAEKIGGQIPIDNMRQTIAQIAANKDVIQPTARGQAFAGESPVTQTLAKLQDAVKDNAPWTVADANGIDDTLRNDIGKARRAGDYQTARSLGIIKNGLKNAYATAAQADPQGAAGFGEWIKGDKLYSAGMAGQEAQDIITNAQRADVPSTAIKNGFKTFVKNDDNRAGLSDEEWAAAEHAAEHGVVTGALKTLGSKAGGMIAGAASGAVGGGPIGAAIGAPLGVAASRPFAWAANARQAGRGEDFIQQIMQRPVVQEALAAKANPPPPAAPNPPAPPRLALPAPQTTNYVNPAGQNVPLSEAGRETIGQGVSGAPGAGTAPSAAMQPGSKMLQEYGNARLSAAGRLPAIPEGNNPQANAAVKTRGIFAAKEAEEAAAKQMQSEKMWTDNTVPPQKLIADSAQKFQEAGLPIGEVGNALLRMLKNQQGSISPQRAVAIGAAVTAYIAAQQGNQKPATGGIGDQNMQELQKLKGGLKTPISAVAPQSNNAQPNAGDFFTKMAKAENNTGNPNAKNPNSSASGAFQFIDSTWKQMVKRYGAETGITLADKNDPKAQQVMAQLYAKDNISQMQPFLKRLPTKGELYMAHLFGADGAVRLINAANNQPDKQAMMLFPRAVTTANHSLFFNGNTPKTVSQLYQTLAQKVS